MPRPPRTHRLRRTWWYVDFPIGRTPLLGRNEAGSTGHRDRFAAQVGMELGRGGRDHVPAPGDEGKCSFTSSAVHHARSGTVDVQGVIQHELARDTERTGSYIGFTEAEVGQPVQSTSSVVFAALHAPPMFVMTLCSPARRRRTFHVKHPGVCLARHRPYDSDAIFKSASRSQVTNTGNIASAISG